MGWTSGKNERTGMTGGALDDKGDRAMGLNIQGGGGVSSHGSLTGLSNANSHPASAISNTPAGTIVATNVQTALDELDAEKVAKSGDTMTGGLQIGTTNKVAFFTVDYFVRASTGLEIQTADIIRFLGAGATEFSRFDSTGKLGIGVAPDATLHVDSPSGAIIRATRLGTGSNVVQMEADGTNGVLRSDGALILSTGGANPRITIDSYGNVGVGAAAGAKLHVASSINDGIKVTDGTTTGIVYSSGTLTNSLAVGTTSNHPLIFGTNNTFPAMTIDTSQRVGIGVAPSYPLHVKGSAPQASFEGDAYTSPQVAFKDNQSNGQEWRVVAGNGNDGSVEFYNATTANEALKILPTGYVRAPGVYANTDASAANVYVDSSGNLKRSTASSGGSNWTESGGQIYPNTLTNQLVIGSGAALGSDSGVASFRKNGTGSVVTLNGVKTAGSDYRRLDISLSGTYADGSAGGATWTVSPTATSTNATDLRIYTGNPSNPKTEVKFLSQLGSSGTIQAGCLLSATNLSTTSAGSASLPAIVAHDDVNTGIYAPASDKWAVATAGTHALTIDSSQRVGIGETTPGNLLTVGANSDTTNQNIRINGKTSTGASAGTLTNAPSAGNPVGYLSVNINGTERKIPYW